MLYSRTPSHWEMTLDFLTYLRNNGSTDSLDQQPKEALKELFTKDYRTSHRAQHPRCTSWSFAAVLEAWRRGKLIRLNKDQPEIVFFTEKSRGDLSTIAALPSNESSSLSAGSTQRSRSRRKKPVGVSVDQFKAFKQAKVDQILKEIPASATGSITSSKQSLPAGITQKTDGRGGFQCTVCEKSMAGLTDVNSHLKSRNHRVQSLLLGIGKNRSALVKDKEGVQVTYSDDGDNEAQVVIQVEEGQKREVVFTIQNTDSEEPVILHHCELLRRRKGFTLDDEHNVTERKNSIRLVKGVKYAITLTINYGNKDWFLRRQSNIIAFAFTKESSPESMFHIIRDIAVSCVNQEILDMMPTGPYRPPPRISARKPNPDLEVIEGEPLPPLGGNSLEREIPLDNYYVPPFLRTIVNSGMKPRGRTEDAQLEHIKSLLDSDLTFKDHKEKFSTLLHIEELQMEVDIRKYDMTAATMTTCPTNRKLLTLQVPGLAENRPSVLKNDRLYVRKHGPDGKPEKKEYQGYVHDLWETEVHLGFSKQLRDNFVPNMKFDVRFTINRLPIKLEHRAVKLCAEKDLETLLFPTPGTVPRAEAPTGSLRFYDRQLEQNTEQAQAVRQMVHGTSRPAPYLVFGPPGTGKTVTVVEAIKQIVKLNKPGTHILACAPSNSAADLLTQRLVKHLNKRQVYRMNALSRHWSTVPEDIRECCNYDKNSRSFFFPSKDTLKNYQVIICTLITAGRLASACFPANHFGHVVIDETGHAMEPEALVAVAGVLAETGGQLILAGDPEQLGPVLRSPVTVDKGLGVSLLERLMKQCEIYQRKSQGDNAYDNSFITKLVRNYRSHPAILKIPNELFYHGELEPHADQLLRESLCQYEKLPKKGFPIIFHGVIGDDMREERSPSFFNPQEAEQVLQYVEDILGSRKGGINVKPAEIGVITPYRKQVEKIRTTLRGCGKDSYKEIKVGSVEEFQGQERKVIIISTVRSSPKFLSMDKDFKLGFLTNPKRFNVALTRAKALLIVIGNPLVLQRDEHWNRFLEYCRDNGAYIDNGCELGVSDDDADPAEDIIQRLMAVKLDNIGGEFADDPEWRSEI